MHSCNTCHIFGYQTSLPPPKIEGASLAALVKKTQEVHLRSVRAHSPDNERPKSPEAG